jgi:hypothetical protein
MGGECLGQMINAYNISFTKPEGFGSLGIDGKIILQFILQK